MPVDFRDLRFKLESLDVMTIQGKSNDAELLVNNMDDESLRSLALMAAKRHTVLNPSSGTKTFDLLENVIIGLRSAECSDLAKQTISIAPDWILRTLILASINRFNSVDQLALREVITARAIEAGDKELYLSADELAQAQLIAAEAADYSAAVERGEVTVDAGIVSGDARSSRKAKEKPVRAPRAAGVKKVKQTPAERAAANRAKKPLVLTKPDPNVKVKTHWLTGKPIVK